MSARDAESGSSTYKGGSRSAGGLGNGGIGGGMGGGGNWGGGMGGGAGRNGGIGNRTGLTTGNTMYGVAGRNGVTFSGRPGGFAQQPGAFGIRPQPAIGTGPLSGVRPRGVVPAAVPGVNPIPEYVPQLPNAWYPPQVPQPSAPINGPAYTGPVGYWQENPTDYPQWSSGGKFATRNYFDGNTYPGGTSYTNSTGENKTFWNADTRYGIDGMARDRGY